MTYPSQTWSTYSSSVAKEPYCVWVKGQCQWESNVLKPFPINNLGTHWHTLLKPRPHLCLAEKPYWFRDHWVKAIGVNYVKTFFDQQLENPFTYPPQTCSTHLSWVSEKMRSLVKGHQSQMCQTVWVTISKMNFLYIYVCNLFWTD